MGPPPLGGTCKRDLPLDEGMEKQVNVYLLVRMPRFTSPKGSAMSASSEAYWCQGHLANLAVLSSWVLFLVSSFLGYIRVVGLFFMTSLSG